MASWFSGRKAPARVPTDIVVPLRFWDDTTVLKSFVLYNLSRYDTAMDPEKLRSSLEHLIARKGWRKLGARLRKNDQGHIEYHIPAAFTAERPAVAFSHERHDAPLARHPLASQLPRAGRRPAVVGDPAAFASLARPPGAPASLDDYLGEDRGQLGLHVVTFPDATLLGLYYTHTCLDGMGCAALLEAWAHELRGRGGDLVQTPVGGDPAEDEGGGGGGGGDFDPLRELGLHPTEPHVLEDRCMGAAGLVGFGLRNALNMGYHAKECRIVCVPGAFVERLHAQAIAELKAEAEAGRGGTDGTDGEEGQEEPFLTHGDVITAWWTRLAVSHMLPPESQRTVTIQNAASARKALSSEFGTLARPYLSNLFTMVYTLVPAQELLTRPVSWLAQQIRKAIVEQGTRAQIEAYFALQRQMPGRVMPFFGESGMQLMTFSNWCKADMFGHDFSPARQDTTDKTPLYPSYLQTVQLPLEVPDGLPIIGRDQSGNYWMSGFRVKGLWAKMEQSLAEIEFEE